MAIPSVLFIENEWEIKKKFALLLIANDYEVIPADSLFNAQRILRACTPQIIICSENLPDGDATDFLTQVRSSKEFSDLPLVIMTSSVDKDPRKFIKLGATDTFHPSTPNDQIMKLIKKQIDIHLPGLHTSASGITGQLHKLSITDLIYELAQRHGSGKITIDGPEEMALYLKEGKIIHARHGVTIGKKALFRCLRIADAAYHFQRNISEVDPSIDEIELEHLIREAAMSNQQLMVHFHKFPSKYSRIRILNTQFFSTNNLKPKVKAAIEIIKRYPLVYKFVDFLNLPDIVCYEMLNSFEEKKIIAFDEKEKSTTILVDNSCDLSPLDFTKHKISVLPLSIKTGEGTMPNRSVHAKRFLNFSAKDWSDCNIVPFTKEGFLQCFSTLNKEYEVLTIAPTSRLLPTNKSLKPLMKEIRENGLEGSSLQEYETSIYQSSTFSIGYGLLTIKASILAAENQPVELLMEKLKHLEDRLQMVWIENQSSEGFLGKNEQLKLYRWNGTDKEVIRKLGKDETISGVFKDEINRRLDVKSNLTIAVGSPHPNEVEKLQAAMKSEFIYASILGFDLTPANMKIIGSNVQMMAFIQD